VLDFERQSVLLFGLWATVNNLTRLRPSRHERYRVTVFGSARTEPGHWVYEEVKQMCAALSAMNCDIITGGGPVIRDRI
jgi:predicted Rossmann-fold nucleotide-binding protein